MSSKQGERRQACGSTIERWQLNKLFGLWAKISPGLNFECDEREARLDYANRVLGRGGLGPPAGAQRAPLQSWSELTRAQAGTLIAAMKRDLGIQNSPFTTQHSKALQYVMWLAPRLYGDDWDALLHDRLTRQPYFFDGSVDQLDGRRLRQVIEEMLGHIARRRIQDSGARSQDEKTSSAELRVGKERTRREMVAAVRGQ